MKNLYFVSGLPRSGSNLIVNILRQNPNVYGDVTSSLCDYISLLNVNWHKLPSSSVSGNESSKVNVIKASLENYHNTERNIVFDFNQNWIRHIGLLEQVTGKRVKVLCMVRNPAEILSSFEKLRKNNPTKLCLADESLGPYSSIMSRAFFYAGPEGVLGLTHSMLKDAVTMGFLDRLLFVDYNRFCNSPKSQMKRVYEFFEMEDFTHDFQNIIQHGFVDEKYKHFYNLKPSLERTTVNCVEFLGLDLYQQYNREIFWDPWI